MISRDRIGDETDHPTQIDEINHHLSPEEEKLANESRGEDGFWSSLWMTLGRAVPPSIRYKFIDINIETQKSVVASGQEIPIEVRITNQAPVTIPVSLTCATFWGWAIDGFQEGTDTNLYTSDPKTVGVRGHQTYSFTRTWSGYIEYRNGPERRFEPLPEGKYALEAWINVPEPEQFGLQDSITIEVNR